MSLREIDRQYQHWASFPPPSIALLRIGVALGIPAPEPRSAVPVGPTSLDELKAFASSVGVSSGG